MVVKNTLRVIFSLYLCFINLQNSIAKNYGVYKTCKFFRIKQVHKVHCVFHKI